MSVCASGGSLPLVCGGTLVLLGDSGHTACWGCLAKGACHALVRLLRPGGRGDRSRACGDCRCLPRFASSRGARPVPVGVWPSSAVMTASIGSWVMPSLGDGAELVPFAASPSRSLFSVAIQAKSAPCESWRGVPCVAEADAGWGTRSERVRDDLRPIWPFERGREQLGGSAYAMYPG